MLVKAMVLVFVVRTRLGWVQQLDAIGRRVVGRRTCRRINATSLVVVVVTAVARTHVLCLVELFTRQV